MDFSLFKNLGNLDLDKAFEVAASSAAVLDEFPDRSQQQAVGRAAPLQTAITSAAVARARQALGAWEEINLEGRKPEWEALCQQIQGHGPSQEEGSSSSSSKAHTAETWAQRAQDAEYKLVQLVSLLIPAPDPVPYFQSVASLSARILEVEDRNRQLTAAAAAASADMGEVEKLVEEHRALQAAHKELQEQVLHVDQELAGAREAAATSLAAQAELAAQAGEMARLQSALMTLREEHERSQSALFDALARHEQEAGSRQREVELVVEELERTQQRLRELEQQQQQQQGSLQQQDRAGVKTAADDAFWERQLQVKADQVAALQAQLEAAGLAAREREAREQVATQQAANRLTALELQVDSLTQELSRRPGQAQHEELAQRAQALALLVDVQMEAEGWGRDDIRGTLEGLSMQSAHGIMQERNRKLASEVSSLKREVAELQGAVSASQDKEAAWAAELQRLQQLVRRLEDDLLSSSGGNSGSVNRGAAAVAAAAGVVPTSVAGSIGAGPSVRGADRSLAGAAAAGAAAAGGAGGAAGGEAADALPARPGTPDTAEGGSSLLDIVVSQRDRFRQRATQLEEENGKLSEDLAKARRQLEECRADNVTLFEKVRYLERYAQQQAAGSSGKMSVLKVDAAGVKQESPDPKANRYQCGPLAFEIGGAGSEAGPAASGGTGPGASARSRGARRAAGAGRLAACFPSNDETGDEEAGGPAEARYSRAYEAKVNPFTEFQKTEAEARVKNMQLHDRAVLAGSKLLVGSRFARAFIAVYAVLLHLFVMLLLYYAVNPATRVEVLDLGAMQPGNVATATAAGPLAGAAATATATGLL